MPAAKPMEIIRQHGPYLCIKSKRKYYCVQWDPEKKVTSGFIPSDKVFRGGWKEFPGWSREAVEHVAKPHKRGTAIAYFNLHTRNYRLQREVSAV